ncbi:hydroxyethylthiazole kinase [Anaerostipes sp.]|uniref:hydroxyethylthiazole kinase n=1 Tax=Anaerostipes sp. TaxID=1872530 RepID=UPI0025C22688|nr:hydroxyethylthiazole kinase [Anaerostipes sp.]MBS7008709.1 hydroxyethylthiazole kinase [Anaerostipes sp.]
MYENILHNVKKHPSLVHCITNYVTVNDVANMVLASGGSPIMADDKSEVEEITSICTSLVINIGTLNARTVEAMVLAGKRANVLGHPVILDPVGAGASSMRTETVKRLLKEVQFDVIRGNISEIKTVFAGSGAMSGVDASEADAVTEENLGEVIDMTKRLSAQTGAVIVVTGAVDIVSDERSSFIIRNGDPMMSRITGTGCMLDGVIAGFVGSNQDRVLEAAAAAVCAVGYCGEKARAKCGGTSSMRMHLIDAMSRLTAEELERGAKVENRS